jgi:hypothetical protein
MTNPPPMDTRHRMTLGQPMMAHGPRALFGLTTASFLKDN